VIYGGTPPEAKRPPWDGGIVWKEDERGLPFLGVACEGFGASSWWPLKDHLSDEPDSMSIALIVPDYLMAVSNGNLRSRRKLAGNFNRWEWFVNYPINSYGVTFYVGDYVHFSQPYENGESKFSLDYYVLAGHEAEAKKHFEQVVPMLKIFEKYFGPYPFPKDGYALIESSYWGMEHQSAIAYGNKFNNLPDYDFDFIIIHESLHEWFGNSLSIKDHAELWIHEAFATYAEWIYLEERYNYDKAVQYALGQRRRIVNKVPMVGPKGVNYDYWPAADIYFKGAWMLHSLRNTVNNDKLWFATLYAFATENRLKFLETEDVIRFFNKKLGADYTAHFNQYLYQNGLPILEFKLTGKGKSTKFQYRWDAAEADFKMPVDAVIKGQKLRLMPTAEWQKYEAKHIKAADVELGTGNFLYEVREVGE
jgi:aminopeptidase N